MADYELLNSSRSSARRNLEKPCNRAYRGPGEFPDIDASGRFPASITVHGGLVYVLNSGGTSIVQGFRLSPQGLTALTGSARSLGPANGDPPNFLTSPGQVGFTPDGTSCW
jgi:hypothetical protein